MSTAVAKKQPALWYVLKLIRVGNLLILVFTQYFVKIFIISPNYSLSDQLQDPNMALLALSTVLVTAAGYMINDYYDVKIDAINKPERVVVDRFLKRRTILILHAVFNLSAFVVAYFLSLKVLAIDIIAATMLWFYSNQWKRLALLGNATIAALSGMSILIMLVFYETKSELVYIYSGFAFVITLIREVVKDIEDMKGDATFNCKTLPILTGVRNTKWFIYVWIIFLMAAAFYFFFERNLLMKYYLFFFIEAPLVWLIIHLYIADKVRDFKGVSNQCKLIMLTGLGSMIFL